MTLSLFENTRSSSHVFVCAKVVLVCVVCCQCPGPCSAITAHARVPTSCADWAGAPHPSLYPRVVIIGLPSPISCPRRRRRTTTACWACPAAITSGRSRRTASSNVSTRRRLGARSSVFGHETVFGLFVAGWRGCAQAPTVCTARLCACRRRGPHLRAARRQRQHQARCPRPSWPPS